MTKSAFKMKYSNSAFPFKTDSVEEAKKLVRNNVGNTTVDSPNYDESKFDKSEKQITKAIDILRSEGYSKGEIEQMTGAGGYKAAMDWATTKKKSK